MEEINVTVTQFIRSLLLQAWRERWSEEKWNISMNKIMPYISGVEGSVLSDVLLEQILVGSSPNVHLLSYLKHALSTQMVGYPFVIKSIIKFQDITRPYCVIHLLAFLDENVDNILCSHNVDDSCLIAVALRQLLVWCLEILLKCVQMILSDSKMQTDVFHMLLEKACCLINRLKNNRFCLALIYIAGFESSDSLESQKDLCMENSPTQTFGKSLAKLPVFDDFLMMEQLTDECIAAISHLTNQLTTEQKSLALDALKFDLSMKNFNMKPKQIIDLSHHNLNISINVRLSAEAILTPMNDINLVIEEILLLEQMQGISKPQLYCELIRSCFLGIIDIASRPDELKWAAFTYLKLPNILNKIFQLSPVEDRMAQLEESFDHLLLCVPLLDLADTKYNCECLHFLLHELCNKYSLLSDAQCRRIMTKRQNESLKSKQQELPSTNQTPNLILRAEPTVTSILKTLDADYSKNQDSLLGVLVQMMSGKSFELILSAAAATGKLQSFAVKLIKFNEFSKQTPGETSKGAQTRSLLFDISFLMLCHITQLYGAEIVVSSQECSSSYFVQWVVHCLPEDGKYKSLDLVSPAEMNKVDVLLAQLNPGGELKTNLTRWSDVCHNAPFAIQEVLLAWECGALDEDTVKVVMDNAKATMCCLPVVISAWLCSNVNICNLKCRQKALLMLQHLIAPLGAETNFPYYTERSNLMQVVLGKIVHELLPPELIPRQNPSAFLLPPKAVTREILIKTFGLISNGGCIDIDNLHKMDYLLNIGGPQWFCEHLVRDVLRHDRPEDLHKGIGLLYSLFQMDVENITLCLLHHTLPNLLQSTGVSMHLLTDPRSSSLAKLCVMCLTVLHTMRQKPYDATSALRGRKRTITDVQLEDSEDGIDDDRPNKLDIGDSVHLGSDGFGLGDIFAYAGSDEDFDCTMQCESKDLLSRTLVNLFRLFYGILADKLISPRTNFVISFILETLNSGNATTRFIFQFMPANTICLLVKVLNEDFNIDRLIQLCDLGTSIGRKTASRVVCQNARCQALSTATSLPTFLQNCK